jgi:hypothetical protein
LAIMIMHTTPKQSCAHRVAAEPLVWSGAITGIPFSPRLGDPPERSAAFLA